MKQPALMIPPIPQLSEPENNHNPCFQDVEITYNFSKRPINYQKKYNQAEAADM